MTENQKITKGNFSDYSLATLLEALDEELKKQGGEKELSPRTYQLIAELGSRELYTCERLVTILLERFLSTGVLEQLEKQQLLTFLPWKKTQASKRLQELVAEGILCYHKRKYALNLEEPFVRRVKESMRFAEKEFDLEALLREFAEERKGSERMNDRPAVQPPIAQFRTLSPKVYRQFVKEIHRLASQEEAVAEEELEDFLKKNILKTVGWTRGEEK